MPKDDKPIYAKNYLVNKWKLSPVAAAGIVGNLQGESGLNTKAVGDNGTSYGIAQWHNERRTALNNFARKQNKDASHLDTQLDYLVYELNTSEKKALNKINLAKTPEQAAIAFMNHFERPAEWAKKESVGKRVAYAKNIFGDNSPTAENINYKEEPTEEVVQEDNSFFKNYVSPQEQQFSYNLPQVNESTTEPSKQFKSDLAKDRIVQKEREQKLIEELSQIFKQEEQVQQEQQQAQQLDPNLYQVYNIQHPELESPQFQQGGYKKDKPLLIDNARVNNKNIPLNNTIKEIKKADAIKKVNDNEIAKDKYYNPEIKRGISSGDKTLDLLYNNQWAMDLPIIGGYIKDQAYKVAKNSAGSPTLNLKNKELTDSDNSTPYSGESAHSYYGVKLLDVYFGKTSLPKAKYKPTSDYLEFLPTYSVKQAFDKTGITNLSSVIEDISGEKGDIKYDAPIYKSNEDNSTLSTLLGVDLGGHKTGISFDKRVGLPYISISDAWDFEPTHYAKKWKNNILTKINVNSSDNKREDVTYIQSSLMHKAGQPFKIYDRLYFDPTTKQYIPDSQIEKKLKNDK